MFMEARDEETGAGMTDEQLRNELLIMIGAGQETTSHNLTWTFYLLSQHPEIEARLVQELDEVLQGRPPTIQDLKNLKLPEQIIKESLRLYPPAWVLMSRKALEDDEICGYHVPAGTAVMILPYVVHRDPRWWVNPERFDPDRFANGRRQDQHRFAYIPFGGGPRKCIGNTFALVEAQLILAAVYQRFTMQVKPGYQVEMDPAFTLRVRGGLPMIVKTRKPAHV